MWTAFIYLMVRVLCFRNTSSLNFFLSQEWEGVNDIGHWTRTKEGLMAKTSGGTKENWVLSLLPAPQFSFTKLLFPWPTAKMLIYVLFSRFPNQLQQSHGPSKLVLDDEQ